jgi:hypothetical protein
MTTTLRELLSLLTGKTEIVVRAARQTTVGTARQTAKRFGGPPEPVAISVPRTEPPAGVTIRKLRDSPVTKRY